jgi:hypothetical protein
MARTFAKTPKGTEEMALRNHGLSPRLRSALILVDGKKTDDALRAMLIHADESLRQLESEGYIQVVAIDGPGGARSTEAEQALLIDLPSLQRAAARFITDTMGKQGDALVQHVGRAKSVPELQVALTTAYRVLSGVTQPEQAEAFRRQFLPG